MRIMRVIPLCLPAIALAACCSQLHEYFGYLDNGDRPGTGIRLIVRDGTVVAGTFSLLLPDDELDRQGVHFALTDLVEGDDMIMGRVTLPNAWMPVDDPNNIADGGWSERPLGFKVHRKSELTMELSHPDRYVLIRTDLEEPQVSELLDNTLSTIGDLEDRVSTALDPDPRRDWEIDERLRSLRGAAVVLRHMTSEKEAELGRWEELRGIVTRALSDFTFDDRDY